MMTDEVPCDGIAAVLPLPVSAPSIHVPTYPLGVACYVVLPYVWRRTIRTSGDTAGMRARVRQQQHWRHTAPLNARRARAMHGALLALLVCCTGARGRRRCQRRGRFSLAGARSAPALPSWQTASATARGV